MNEQNYGMVERLAALRRAEMLVEAADERRVRQARQAARLRGQASRPTSPYPQSTLLLRRSA